MGCESREASESDASDQDEHSAADESADDVADDEADAADEEALNECVLCSRQLIEDYGISFTCDGSCGLDFEALQKRWTCKARKCEFDICPRCMTAQNASGPTPLLPAQPVIHSTPPPAAPPSQPRPPAEPVGQSRPPLDADTTRGVPPAAAPALHAPATATATACLSPSGAPPAFRPVVRGDMPTIAGRMDLFARWQREHARERAAATAASAAPAALAEAPGILRPPLAAAPMVPGQLPALHKSPAGAGWRGRAPCAVRELPQTIRRADTRELAADSGCTCNPAAKGGAGAASDPGSIQRVQEGRARDAQAGPSRFVG